jgi:hypothetical protein
MTLAYKGMVAAPHALASEAMSTTRSLQGGWPEGHGVKHY